MFRSKYSHFALFGGFALVIASSAILFHGRIFSWVADYTAPILTPLSAKLSGVFQLVSTGMGSLNAVQKIRELEDKNQALTAVLVNQDQRMIDLEFYRSVAKLREHVPSEPLVAGIFSYTRAGGVLQAVLNRGSSDGVVRGDVVITAQEELVGIVDQVFTDYAIVHTLGDATFEVTARVANSSIAGLIRSGVGGTVVLDLVQKNEVISEGAVVVTSGDDRFPAGLIIGTVRSVDSEAVPLFQIVRVTPAISSGIRGAVLVFRP